MWQQWVNALLGLWVIALAFLGLSSEAQMWTLAVTGLVIGGLAMWGAVSHEQMVEYREQMT
ncbi:MAG: hypothetical protein WA021_05565 [Minisyncoccia bacterium]